MAEKWPRDLWLDAIWEDEALKPNERVVAYVYARFAGRTDTAWASYGVIMRRTGMKSKRSVSAAIKGLVDAGWLTQTSRARQHYSGVYQLTCPLQQFGSATAGDDFSGSDSTPLAETSDAIDDPAVAIWHPAVANLHASGSNAAPQYSDRDLKVEISDTSKISRSIFDRADFEQPHVFVEGDAGLCRCHRGRSHSLHQSNPAPKRKRSSGPFLNPPSSAYDHDPFTDRSTAS